MVLNEDTFPQWRSQSKNLGGQKIWRGRITLFCLEKRLSKHKMTIFSKNLGGHGPFGSPWLRLCVPARMMARNVIGIKCDNGKSPEVVPRSYDVPVIPVEPRVASLKEVRNYKRRNEQRSRFIADCCQPNTG